MGVERFDYDERLTGRMLHGSIRAMTRMSIKHRANAQWRAVAPCVLTGRIAA
jgi:hypothetical protein